jgi:predicted AlkP superfamily phosphohydrolase/phosphomutase
VVNIPLTHPPQELEGFLIAGFDAPDTPRQKVYPESLHDELRETYGAAVLETPPPETAKSDPAAFFAGYAAHDRLQTQATIDLVKRHGLGVVAINLMLNDHLSHFMADFSYVQRGLEVSDENIGRLRQAFPEASLIVISDHGSARTRATFLMFDWLLREGLIRLDIRKDRARRLGFALGKLLRQRWALTGYPEKVLRHLLRPLLARLPVAAQEYLIARIVQDDDFYWPWEAIDREASEVIMCSPAIGGFYLNGKPGLREELSSRLANLADNDGRPIVSRLLPREEAYKDGLSGLAPDIMSVSEFNLRTSSALRRKPSLIIDNRLAAFYGNHTPEGIYVLAGDEFHDGFRQPLHIWDIPAMILRLAGLAIPADFEATLPGGVLRRPLERETTPAEPEDQGAEDRLSAEDLAAVQERLKGLGYM